MKKEDMKKDSGKYPDKLKEESGYYVTAEKQQGEYTLEDYRRLPEDIRAELIDGTIYYMASPLSVHQLLAARIYSVLARYIERNKGACIPLFAPLDVQLDKDDKTVVQPDVMILCDRKKLTRNGIFGAPDFIVEILSENTRKKDSYLKLMKYQKAGVKEYWLVDPDKKKIIVYDLDKEEIPVIYGFEDKVPVRIFQGKCEVDFSLIYEDVKFIFEQS